MKKIGLFLLAAVLLACLASAALADVKPGEEVSVTLNLSNTNAAYVRVVATYDQSVFDLIGYTANSGTAGGNGIVMYDTKALPSGAVGTVTLKVKEGAAPGTYNVGASLAECYDINENNGSASVSGGTVTVAGKATPAPTATPVPVTDAPTATPDPVTDAPTATPVPVTDAPTATPVPVTDAPTSTPAPVTDAPTATPVPVTDAPTEAPTTTPTNPPASSDRYTAQATFDPQQKFLQGTVTLNDGAEELSRVFARITYFFADGTYTTGSVSVFNGEFEGMTSGDVIHVGIQIVDTYKVRPGEFNRFGATEFDVE